MYGGMRVQQLTVLSVRSLEKASDKTVGFYDDRKTSNQIHPAFCWVFDCFFFFSHHIDFIREKKNRTRTPKRSTTYRFCRGFLFVTGTRDLLYRQWQSRTDVTYDSEIVQERRNTVASKTTQRVFFRKIYVS